MGSLREGASIGLYTIVLPHVYNNILGYGLFSVLFINFFETSFILCNLGWPGAHYGNQAGLKLKEIHLLLPPRCWD